MSNFPVRWLWFAAGWVCVALGFIGALLPVMPSTVFFVAAAACFARSSPKFEAWVLNLPVIGKTVKDYRAGLGMKRRTKIMVLWMIGIACTISAFTAPPLIAKVSVVVLGAIGIWYVWTKVPTRGISQVERST